MMILHVTEQGRGPTLVLLHGLFGSGRNLGVLQRGLAGQFRVLAVDLRNHGDSPHAPSMSYPEMASDVAETLVRLGPPPAHVLGHSMGGKVAMRLALDRPDMVRRLIVADVAPVRNSPRFGPMAEAMRGLPPGLSRREADDALAPAIADPSLRGFLLLNYRAGGWRIGIDEIIANLPVLEGWSAPPDVQFGGPTLFLAGARSHYLRPEHRAVIHALFPAARIVTIKDAGHWLHADNPRAVIAVVEAFLNASSAGDATAAQT